MLKFSYSLYFILRATVLILQQKLLTIELSQLKKQVGNLKSSKNLILETQKNFFRKFLFLEYNDPAWKCNCDMLFSCRKIIVSIARILLNA